MRLNNQVAIITGAAQGIGKGIAQVFLREGARVAIVDMDEKKGKNTAFELDPEGDKVFFVGCDLTEEDQVIQMVSKVISKFNRIDILINNVGASMSKPICETTLSEWEACMDTNLKCTFLCCKHVIPYMLSSGKGAIVNISSVLGYASDKRSAPYAAAKSGVIGLTRSLAVDYGPVVRANSIVPGWVLTPQMQSEFFDRMDDPVGERTQVEQNMAMKRLGLPEDIGYAALFLISDEASYITGTQLFVDGGQCAQLRTGRS
jgi:NAD(P)-dependent dehydrogenase (short-subunit alcohol dehydrogenase family)